MLRCEMLKAQQGTPHIARQATRIIAINTTHLGDLVISGFNNCEMCGHAAHYLFERADEDGDRVYACERCVDEYRLSYVAE